MTSRLIFILLTMLWSAYAVADEVESEPEQSNHWLGSSTHLNTDKQKSKASVNNQSAAHSQKEQPPKSERSRLGGMFDLLLPSGLRDNQ